MTLPKYWVAARKAVKDHDRIIGYEVVGGYRIRVAFYRITSRCPAERALRKAETHCALLMEESAYWTGEEGAT